MPKTLCGFCEKSNKITQEHAWPQWIGRLLTKSYGRPPHTISLRRDQRWRRWPTNQLNVKVRAVCESCNTGWMSDVEAAVQPFFTPMITSRAKTMLNNGRQTKAALWAIKTAMVMEYLNKAEPYYLKRERRSVMKALTPPDNTVIWIGRYLGRWGCHSLSQKLAIPSRGAWFPFGFSSTITAGQIVIQVLSYRLGETIRGPADIKARRGPWELTLLQIWPPDEDTITWPPPVAFNDASLEILEHRFTSPLLPPLPRV